MGAGSKRVSNGTVTSSHYPMVCGGVELMLLNATGRLMYRTVLPTPCLQTL